MILSQLKNQHYQKTLLFLKKNKYKTLIILLSVFILYYYFFLRATTTAVVETYSVSKAKLGSISNTINGSGQIIPVNTLELKTKTSGDISSILVKAGDKVKQGQPLVRLNASQALQKVRTAEVNLEQAKLDLEKLEKPAETLEVTQIKNAIAKSEADIKNQDLLVANAYKNLLNASFEAVAKSTNSNDVAPVVSGSYLGKTEGEIDLALYGSGDGTVFSISGLTTGTGYVNSVTAQPVGDSGLYIKFAPNTTQTNWTILIPNKKATNYLSLSTAYQNALDTKERTVADLQRSGIENTLRLDKVVKGADDIDIRAKNLVIRQRENDLAQARSDYADSIISAPFDGTIATLTADIGTTVTSGVTLGTIITDKQVAKISLNEVDVSKLSLGQKAVLTFDAINGLSATSSVAEIDTLGTVTQGVVTYAIKLLFSLDDARVKPGMSVMVDIISEKKDNSIILPLAAVMQDKSGTYVERITSILSSTSKKLETKPQVERVVVITGISNDMQIEILSGVSLGDEVLITKKTSSKTVQTPTAASVLSGTAGRRQGGF